MVKMKAGRKDENGHRHFDPHTLSDTKIARLTPVERAIYIRETEIYVAEQSAIQEELWRQSADNVARATRARAAEEARLAQKAIFEATPEGKLVLAMEAAEAAAAKNKRAQERADEETHERQCALERIAIKQIAAAKRKKEIDDRNAELAAVRAIRKKNRLAREKEEQEYRRQVEEEKTQLAKMTAEKAKLAAKQAILEYQNPVIDSYLGPDSDNDSLFGNCSDGEEADSCAFSTPTTSAIKGLTFKPTDDSDEPIAAVKQNIPTIPSACTGRIISVVGNALSLPGSQTSLQEPQHVPTTSAVNHTDQYVTNQETGLRTELTPQSTLLTNNHHDTEPTAEMDNSDSLSVHSTPAQDGTETVCSSTKKIINPVEQPATSLQELYNPNEPIYNLDAIAESTSFDPWAYGNGNDPFSGIPAFDIDPFSGIPIFDNNNFTLDSSTQDLVDQWTYPGTDQSALDAPGMAALCTADQVSELPPLNPWLPWDSSLLSLDQDFAELHSQLRRQFIPDVSQRIDWPNDMDNVSKNEVQWYCNNHSQTLPQEAAPEPNAAITTTPGKTPHNINIGTTQAVLYKTSSNELEEIPPAATCLCAAVAAVQQEVDGTGLSPDHQQGRLALPFEGNASVLGQDLLTYYQPILVNNAIPANNANFTANLIGLTSTHMTYPPPVENCMESVSNPNVTISTEKELRSTRARFTDDGVRCASTHPDTGSGYDSSTTHDLFMANGPSNLKVQSSRPIDTFSMPHSLVVTQLNPSVDHKFKANNPTTTGPYRMNIYTFEGTHPFCNHLRQTRCENQVDPSMSFTTWRRYICNGDENSDVDQSLFWYFEDESQETQLWHSVSNVSEYHSFAVWASQASVTYVAYGRKPLELARTPIETGQRKRKADDVDQSDKQSVKKSRKMRLSRAIGASGEIASPDTLRGLRSGSNLFTAPKPHATPNKTTTANRWRRAAKRVKSPANDHQEILVEADNMDLTGSD